MDVLDPILEAPLWWGRHLPLLTMVTYAGVQRRSLGAVPSLLAAVAGVLAALLLRDPVGLAALPVRVADLIAAPMILFFLARRQVIPGLRRGQMTAPERARWIIAAAGDRALRSRSRGANRS